jgi:glycerol-3-phosphate dehydrogenase
MQEISKIPGYKDKVYILAMKGVEASTGRTNSEITMSYNVKSDNIAVFAGPGQPNSIVENKKINKMVVAAYNKRVAKEIAGIIKTENFQFYPWPDVIGCELCGAFKNVYSALGGMCQAAEHETLKGHIMSVSLNEMRNYLKGMQCNPETAIHFALLADYNATLYDPVSHNLTYGKEVVKQQTANPTLDFNSVEGKHAVTGLIKRMTIKNATLSDAMQIKAPLLTCFKDIVDEKIQPKDIVKNINKVLDSSLNEWAEKSFDLSL